MGYKLGALMPMNNVEETVINNSPLLGKTLDIVKVCCINSRAVYDYVKRRLPDQAELIFKNLPEPYCSMSNCVDFFLDENNWVSSDIIVKLFENAKTLLDDPEAAFKIGIESIANHQLGYIQKFFISTFSNVGSAIKRMNYINAKFTSTKVTKIVHDAPEHLVFRLHWNKDAHVSKDICLYNKGIYSAIPTLWNLELGVIEEPFCYFQGDPYCEYDCTWKEKRSTFLFLNNLKTRKSALLDALKEIERDKNLLKLKYDEVNDLNLELQDKIIKLEAINKASGVMVSYEGVDKFLNITMDILVKVLRFDRAILMLKDNSRQNSTTVFQQEETPSSLSSLKITGCRFHETKI